MRHSKATSMFSLANILYTLGRVQHNCIANQVTVRPCSRSVRRIRFPMWHMPPASFPARIPCGPPLRLRNSIYMEKARESYPCPFRVPRPSHAHLSRTDNAESPRRYVYGAPFPRARTGRTGVDIHTTRTLPVAICSLDRFRSCEVLKLESQTPVNVFSSIYCTCPTPSLGSSAAMCGSKFTKKGVEKRIRKGFFPFHPPSCEKTHY